MNNIQKTCINTLRFLSIDMVERAKSGHPGAPMGMATIAFTLWQNHLKHVASESGWLNRDRFVLSAGHASALLYSLLHVYGYNIPVEELRNFRQLGSKTPGHPERDIEVGIETTTGPLGQGFANAVGIAMAEKWLAGRYNRSGYEIINHYTYVLASDGDMMEGVSSEAASMAGSMELGKLICLYDDNDISIEGSTDLTFTEDVGKRFGAYGWHVIGPIDGNSVEAVDKALIEAKRERSRPSIIICKTCIGYGSPNKCGKASAHGEPLGVNEAALTRNNLDWNHPPFFVPQVAADHFDKAVKANRNDYGIWLKMFREYKASFPAEAAELEMAFGNGLPAGWEYNLESLMADLNKPMATREVSGIVLNELVKKINNLVGGSADLAPSTKTVLADRGYFGPENYSGNNIHFGVREHAMGAIANGMSLHGGIIPYTATFLIFYDYMRPPVRLAAMMGLGVVFLFTHDSIGLGEDGPTHQPVEQIMGLRLVPGLVTLRPADAAETIGAWRVAIKRRHNPTAIVLTRQKLPLIQRSHLVDIKLVERGAYIIWETEHAPEIVLIATGSEVQLAVNAAINLKEQGINARVVSMPSWELFDLQDKSYRESIIPSEIKVRISIEAGRTIGWQKYIGEDGLAMGIDRFGVSAPWEDAYAYLGLTVERIISEAKKLLEK
ncbi:MAG: transketolase [Dehalococcoidales bacterium]|jgi:transketolase|nr:transketolase [Dehalococcoidales bacterium]MDX9986420.1 transketolase [Dehalococcoidales bacterium]NLE90463.1 transketolase [Dehalococcoidales bacterium]